MHSRAPEIVSPTPIATRRGLAIRRLLAGAVAAVLAGSGIVFAPASAVAEVTPGQPVVIDGFDGTRLGTRTIERLPAPGTSTTAAATFTESNGAAFITAGGNGNAAAGVKISYAFPQSDLTAAGNNTQLFFEFDSISRTPVQMVGETAMSVTATITDANGVTGSYNTGIANASSQNIVLNFNCLTPGAACFTPSPDFTRVTALSVTIMYPRNYDQVASLSTVLKVIRTTPTGGLSPAAPTPSITTASTSILNSESQSVDYTVAFHSDGRQVTSGDFTASDITVGGTAPGAAVTGFVRDGNAYRVTVGPLTDSGTVELGVAAGAFTDSWGQPSRAGSAPTVTFVRAVAPVITALPDASFQVGAAATPSSATATGTPAPTFTASGLPAGLTLSSAGVLSGTPEPGSGGVHAATITAANVAGSVSAAFTLNVREAPWISPLSTSTFTAGSPASAAFTLTGHPAPTVTVIEGALPAGLQLAPNGVLSGTPTAAAAGTHSVTVRASNVLGSADRAVTLEVTLAPSITSDDEVTLRVGEASAFTVTASGHPAATFSVIGSLPSGVALSADGGLRGTPAGGSGGEYDVQFRAANSAGSTGQPVTVRVEEAPTISAPASFAAAESEAMPTDASALAITTQGFPAPSIALAPASAVLPAGLSLADRGDGTATIVGTPAAGTGGVHTVTIRATSPVAELGSASTTVTLVVSAPPRITTPAAKLFALGEAVDFPVVASGHPAPVFAAGTIVPGVTIDASGRVTGAPTVAGAASATVTASNATATASASFPVTVTDAPAVTSAAAATFTVGDAATFAITTAGFPAPSLTLSGALPDGVAFLDAGDGTATLSGTPLAGEGGAYDVVIVASNSIDSASQPFTLTVAEPPVVETGSGGPRQLTLGGPGTPTLAGGGFPAPVFTIVSGTLPAGITLAPDGRILGSPLPGAGGVHDLTVSAANGSGTVSFPVQLVVNEEVTFTSPAAAQVVAGAPVSIPITLFGYPVPSIAIVAGSLPEGLGLVDHGDGTATISGTPQRGSGGEYRVQVGASQVGPLASFATAPSIAYASAQQLLALTVQEAPGVASARATGTAGTALSFDVTAIGFPYPTLTVGGLPAGLSFTDHGDGTGTIAGVPEASGVAAVALTASNALGTSAGVVTFELATAPAAPGTPPVAAPAATPRGELGVTGADATPGALAGLGLLVLGLVVLSASRARRRVA